MSEVNPTVDASCCLVTPNVGDGEVTQIAFSYPNAIIQIKLSPSGVCNLNVVNCRYLWCVTEHVQNVIDRIYIYSDVSKVEGIDADVLGRVSQLLSLKAGKVIHIIPITGPDMVCLGDDVEVVAHVG